MSAQVIYISDIMYLKDEIHKQELSLDVLIKTKPPGITLNNIYNIRVSIQKKYTRLQQLIKQAKEQVNEQEKKTTSQS